MNLSPHFTLKEAIHSETANRLGLLNTPPDSVLLTMAVAAKHLEVVRSLLNMPMKINSWYRCPAVNTAVGSKDTSQHKVGEAIDFICPLFGDPLAICRLITLYEKDINFDQLILEHSWVHISFAILSGKPRGQVLSLLNSGHYAYGLTDTHGTPYK